MDATRHAVYTTITKLGSTRNLDPPETWIHLSVMPMEEMMLNNGV
jgi:hypothetical protein